VSAVLAPRLSMLPMHPADLDEIVEIENRVYPFPWTRGNFIDSIACGYSVWGCRFADELVGYYVLMMAVDEAHLLNISVAGKRQGMGFGARLLAPRHAPGALAGALHPARGASVERARRWRSIGISAFNRSACDAATTRQKRDPRMRW
jgi:ribosomal-protein-alanine N-acetyltransferase